MNKIFTFILSLLLTSSAFSQLNNYDEDSKWFLGLNAGATWQTTDVKNKFDGGYGFTLGKSFNYNYGRKVSFDLRARFLRGYWYGQDYDSTGFNYPNTALSSGKTDYQDSMGFMVNNFQTDVYRLSLELVLHANGIRERTRWDPYIFGGIGITWSQTYGNLLFYDSTGTNTMYRYDQLSSLDKASIDNLLDNTYDTPLDGTNANSYTATVMPSIGFGIGYQVGKRVTIGLEHKTTFTRNDLFDGYANPNSKNTNDIYHYTSAYIQFRFKARKEKTPPPVDNTNDNSLNNLPNYTENRNDPPVVNFTDPASSGRTVNSPAYTIRGEVRNVSGRENINFTQNGNYNGTFSYDPASHQFTSNVTLVPGQNVFQLTGTNPYGSDQESTIIIYQREQQAVPPVVTITNPASSPQQTSDPVFPFRATVLNVSQKSQITFTFNGQTTNNFTYDPATSAVSASLNLTPGTNIVTVTGTNDAGSDSESTTIIYRQNAAEQPPVVYYLDPASTPYTVQNPNFTINATILNVSGSQYVTFRQNGSVNNSFTFNPAANAFQSNVVLVPGQNVFEIIGTNNAGSASATTIIVYERAAPKPPVVTITNPNVSPYSVSNQSFNLAATVLNVSQKSQVNVKLNGQNLANFSYDNSTNGVAAVLSLVEGSNTVTVTGTNNDGTDSKQTIIIYRPVQTEQPPVVTFVNPNVNPYTTDQATFNVLATVLNVASQSGVNVNVNGANYTAFNFNAVTKMTSFSVNLIEGANIITVTGTNTAGTDTKTQTIIYRKQQTLLPPVVTFTDPVTNPITVFDPVYDVQTRVRYVNGSQNIQLRINGVLSTNFSYSVSSEMMNFTTSLMPGANIIEVRGTNAVGTDIASTTIIYRKPQPQNPPVVTITTPQADPYTVTSASTVINATVLNIEGAQNVSVTVNGNNFGGFIYNAATKIVAFTMPLVEGSNSVIVTGTNNAGQASDQTTIIYRKESLPLPHVTFTNPSQPGTTVSTPGYQMRAIIQNVDSKQGILVKQDGQTVNPNLYSFNAGNHEVIFNTSLNAGSTIFYVSGTNTAGTHSASTQVNYQRAACKGPEVTIVNPAAAGTSTETASFNFSAKLLGVDDLQHIVFKVNGIAVNGGSFNASTKLFSHTVLLNEGSNSLEISGTNECGTASASTIVTYTPAAQPCIAPGVTAIVPSTQQFTTDQQSVTVKVATVNIENASQVIFQVNNTVQQFSFDSGSHIVSAQVPLNEGANTISVTVANDCGRDKYTWTITRKVCQPPFLAITGSTVPNGSTTTGNAITITASVDNVASMSQITATQNGQPVNFIYNPQTKTFSLNRELVIGVNTLVMMATNECGKDSETIKVVRKEVNIVKPPLLKFIAPLTSPYNTDEASMDVKVNVQNVSAANQISVTVNGQPVNFNFNASNGDVQLHANWSEGANVIVATAVNSAGTASDTRTVVYRKKVTEQPPVVSFTSPGRCPSSAPPGNYTISGNIQNVSSSGQVSITVNGQAITNYTTTVSGNVMSYSFVTNMVAGAQMTVVVTATNTAGSDTQTCVINVHQASVEGNSNMNSGSLNGGGLINKGSGSSGSEEDDDNDDQNNGGNSGRTINTGSGGTKTGTRPVNGNTRTTTPGRRP